MRQIISYFRRKILNYKTFNTYKKKCKEIKKSPTDKEDFYTLLDIIRKNLSISAIYIKKNPFVVMRIDNNFVLYAGLKTNTNTVVINIWSNDEFKFLNADTGVGVQ